MATGTATLDFGAFPGSTDTSVAVTGQTGIVAGSLVEAWLMGSTADHSEDEHFVEPLRVFAGKIVAGTGFTIFGRADGMPLPPPSPPVLDRPGAIGGGDRRGNVARDAMVYGQWKVAWAWL